MRIVSALAGLSLAASPCAAAPLLAPPTPPPAAVLPADGKLGAAQDDTDFLFRLGMVEGHLMVGHELLAAHRPGLALPHFGHPVRELYDDIAGYLAQKKFAPFDRELVALEAAVAAAPEAPETEAKYQAAIATIRKARGLAPAELRQSVPEMIAVCSSVIDAASGEFGEALERGRISSIVEYHDSRGFLDYVQQQLAELRGAHPEATAQSVFDRFAAALAKAQWIVGELIPDATPRASVATYRAIAAEAAATAKPAVSAEQTR